LTLKMAFRATILSPRSMVALDALKSHAPTLDEDVGLHVADRVLEEALALVVHLHAVAGEALFSAYEDDVAFGHDAARDGPVRLRRLEQVRPVGLDAHAGHAKVHEPARLDVSLLDLLVGLGAYLDLAGRGRFRGGGARRLLGRGGGGRRLLGRGGGATVPSLGEGGDGGGEKEPQDRHAADGWRHGRSPGASRPKGRPCP
jgi:hypothetical protein